MRFRPTPVPVGPTRAVEPLEARIAPATLIWDGSAGDGDWFNPQNWNQNAVPGTADTAILDTTSTINLTNNVDVGSFQQRAGTLTGPGTLRIVGTFLWAGGTMTGAGSTHADGGLTINGSTVFLGRTLHLPQGQIATLSGPNASVGFQNNASFNNAGSFLAQSDSSFFLSGGTNVIFNNMGVFSREATTADFTIGIPFANFGVVNVAAGMLSFTGGDSLAPTTGDFNVASGATLQFRSVFDLAPGADITGAGSVDFRSGTVTTGGTLAIQTLLLSGGTATLDAASNAATMNISNGTLNGSGAVTVSGLITWSGGTMSGTGTTNAAGGLLLNGVAVLSARTFILPSGETATLTGNNSALGLQNGAQFRNAGTFLAQDDTSSDLFNNGIGAAPLFDNSGIFTRDTTPGDFSISVPFANSGIVNVATGTLTFTGGDGPAATTGDFNVSAGAILDFNGDFDLVAGADVTGTGTVDFSGNTVTLGGAFAVPTVLVTGGAANFNTPTSGLQTLNVSTGTANFNTTDTIALSTLTLSGGILTGTNTITVSGLITWSGGTMSGTGTTNAAGGLLLNGVAVLSARTVVVPQGETATLTGNNSALGLQNGAQFRNAGTFLAQDDTSSDLFNNGIGAAPLFDNSGIFTRDTTPGDFSISVPFANSGIVNVAAGTLTFTGGDGPAATTGDFNVSAGAILDFNGDFDLVAGADVTGTGTVDFSGNTVTLGGAFAVPTVLVTGGAANFNTPTSGLQTLNVSTGTANFNTTDTIALSTLTLSGGILTGTNTITVSGLITWSGGTMSGTGTTNAAGGLLLNGVAVLSARTVVVPQGETATLTGNNSALGLQNGAQFRNAGTFLAQDDTSSDLFNNGIGAAPLFDNSGIFTRDTTPGDFSISVPFANSGIVNVAAGTLTFTGGDGPAATTGDFNVSAGALLDISSQFDFAAGSGISGNGTVEFSRDIVTVAGGFDISAVLATGATVDFNAPTTGLQSLSISSGTVRFNTNDSIDLASLTVTGGTLGGTNTISAAGLITWSGGIMNGSGVTNANGGLLINGTDVTLSGRTLNLAAGQTTALNSGDGFGMQNGARVNNAGTFLVQTDISNEFFSGGGTPSLFTNSGTLVFETPTTNELEILFPVANSGVIDLRTGGMRLTGGYAQAATGQIVGDKSVTFSGGIVAAAGTIVGNVFNTGAVLSPGELGVGTLGITGDYTQSPGAMLRIELGGLAAGQFDQLNVSGTATLNNTLNLALIPGFIPPDGTQFPILTYSARTGTFGSTTGVADFTLDYQPTAVVLTSISITSDFVWDAGGGLDTSWFNSANWGPDGVPGPADTATLSSNAIITLPSAAIVSRFTQIDGTFTGPGLLTTLDFTWFGGTQAGAGITAVPIGGSFSIEGDSTKTVSERTLRLSGTGKWSDAGDLEMNDGARITNAGSFEIQNNARMEFIGVGATPLFLNSGIVRKTIGTGSTTIAGIDFENAGQLRLDSGTLLVEGASATFTQSRGATLLTGGSLSAPSAVVTYTGGSLAGSGTIAASVINSGAKVHPGGAKSGGTLAITGDYTQSGTARLIIELAGKAAGAQHDRFSIGGIATLGGTLEVNSIGGFALRDQTSFDVVSYGSFSGVLPRLDAPAGVNPSAGAGALTLNALAPAPGPRSVTFTDADGDVVTAKVTKGSIPLNAIITGANGEFQKLDLRSVESKLNGAKLIINVDQTGNGDGAVNVGAIDATGMDLAKVKVTGDLGQIDIGTGANGKTALKSLVVGSLGALGAATQQGDTDDPLLSEITGALDKLTVTRDVQNAVVAVTGKLGKVTIGGSLVDNRPSTPLAARSGSIDVFLNGGIPPVGSSEAGSIFAPTIDSVTVMGDIDGGEISAETQIKKVKVVGRLTSEDPLDPAILRVGSEVSKVVVTGDVKNALILAGYNRSLEPVNPDAKIGKVVVKGNWIGTSVVAGISDPGDNGFGIADALISGDTTPDRLAKIASVIIQGTAMGSATPSDNSGITAQAIGKLRISDADVALTDGLDNITLDPLNQNFRAVEV